MATTSKAIQILDRVGADIIELGVPYSVSMRLFCLGCLTQLLPFVLVNTKCSLQHDLETATIYCPTIPTCLRPNAHQPPCMRPDCKRRWQNTLWAHGRRTRLLTDLPFRQLQHEPCCSSMSRLIRYQDCKKQTWTDFAHNEKQQTKLRRCHLPLSHVELLPRF